MDKKSYRLSTEQLRSIYDDSVYPTTLAGLPQIPTPKFVIICAQPGAGKSGLSNRIRSAFVKASAKAAHIDVDDLRKYHARLSEIMAEDPVGMGDHTHADMGVWKGYLLQDARSASNNTVLEITLQSADNTKVEIERFQKDGFGVELHAMAVHEHVSRLGIFKRFEDAVAITGALPRYVAVDYHDAAYHAMPRNVDDLERSFALNLVTVNTRGGDIVYSRTEQEGNPEAMKSILLERNRSWSAADRSAHITEWESIVKQVKGRSLGDMKTVEYLADLHKAVLLATGEPVIHVPAHAIEQDVENIIRRAVNSRALGL